MINEIPHASSSTALCSNADGTLRQPLRRAWSRCLQAYGEHSFRLYVAATSVVNVTCASRQEHHRRFRGRWWGDSALSPHDGLLS